MNFFCHGRSLNRVPARGPAVTGTDSTKAMTRSARLRPGNSHECGPTEGGNFPGEGCLIVLRPGSARPISQLYLSNSNFDLLRARAAVLRGGIPLNLAMAATAYLSIVGVHVSALARAHRHAHSSRTKECRL